MWRTRVVARDNISVVQMCVKGLKSGLSGLVLAGSNRHARDPRA